MRTIIATAFALALLSPGAQAAGTVYKLGAICKWDLEQYCKGISRKRIRELKECLAKHEKDLFSRCQDHYKEAVL
jgi:hypothetical protein